MIKHSFAHRVRYAETDQMGFVYYGNYATYYEIGRVEAMRSIGIEYAKLETEHEIWMPVVNMSTRFLRPGKYDEVLNIVTEVRKLPSSYITFDYEIYNGQNQLINGANVRLCFIDATTQKRVPVPTYIIEKMQPYF